MKEEWLSQFENENTRRQYEISLEQFEKHIGQDLKNYCKNNLKWEEFWKDLKSFWKSLSDKAPKTQNNRLRVVKLFFNDHGVEIPDSEWSKFRRRRMKSSRPQTQDRAGRKDEWQKIILNMSSPQGRALYLTLLSTGARIGEILQTRTDDLDLDSDPARIHLRAEYTKGGVGDRIVFLTYEAETAVRDYLKWREGKTNAAGVSYDDTDELFPFTQQTARQILYNALERAGLDDRDRTTDRRKIHTHSTRKFFRSNCGLDEALTHAIMGHREYLDRSYLRVNPERAAAKFKNNMQNIEVLRTKTTEEKEESVESKILKKILKDKDFSKIENFEKITELLKDIE